MTTVIESSDSNGRGSANTKSSPSAGRAVAKASSTVGFFTLLSRILGMVRDMIVAAKFGAGVTTDAFFVAFKVPNLLRSLVAEGSLSTAFVPIFTEAKHRSPEEAKLAVGAVTTFVVAVTAILSFFGIIYAKEITLLFAPGFGPDSERANLATSLMALMFPFVVLISLIALSASVLNSVGRFAAPASSSGIQNLAMIAGVFLGSLFFVEPIYGLAWSVLIGGSASLALQLWQLKAAGYPLHFANPFTSPVVRRLCRLMLPSILSASLYQFMIFINTLLASLLIEKTVSWLFYADRIFQFPIGVFSLAVATAVLPALSRSAAEGDNKGLATHLEQALGWITFGTLPAAVGLALLSEPIMALLFERGNFTPQDRIESARALMAFSVGLWSISLQSILVRGFLSKKNSLIPSLISACSLLVNVCCSFIFMGAPHTIPTDLLGGGIASLLNTIEAAGFSLELAHVGLALSGSVATSISAVALYLMLPSVGIYINHRRVLIALAKTVISCGAMAAAVLSVESLGLSLKLLAVLGIPVGGIAFLASAYLLKMIEAQQILDVGMARLRRRRTSER